MCSRVHKFVYGADSRDVILRTEGLLPQAVQHSINSLTFLFLSALLPDFGQRLSWSSSANSFGGRLVMRLIDTETLEIHEFVHEDHIPRYAILSHCWGDDEVTFKQFVKKQNREGAGYLKIVESCAFARARDRDWIWIDTCCIDKRSSTELSEAINSMYKWYQDALECYAYLIDVTASPEDTVRVDVEFRESRWFRRGWTLQELIAPRTVIFLTQHWQRIYATTAMQGWQRIEAMNMRRPWGVPQPKMPVMNMNAATVVSQITRIPLDVLRAGLILTSYSFAQRLSWMASRSTSREEDQAYSLFGLFGLNMPLLYGEGSKALQRLQVEVLNQTGDESIFVRAIRTPGLLVAGNHYFKGCQHVERANVHDRRPITISARWAELQLTRGRAGVFCHRRDKSIHVVRLNCAHSKDGKALSPCIMFLRSGICGHFFHSRSTEAYLRRTDGLNPYCERDLENPDEWIPVRSDAVVLIHLHPSDQAATCQNNPKSTLSARVMYHLENHSPMSQISAS